MVQHKPMKIAYPENNAFIFSFILFLSDYRTNEPYWERGLVVKNRKKKKEIKGEMPLIFWLGILNEREGV